MNLMAFSCIFLQKSVSTSSRKSRAARVHARNVTGLSCVSTRLCAMGSALQRHMDLLSGSETASLATGAVQYSTLDAAEGGYRASEDHR